MGKELQDRIEAFVNSVQGDTVSVAELINAFATVEPGRLGTAILKLTKDGTIQVCGDFVTATPAAA